MRIDPLDVKESNLRIAVVSSVADLLSLAIAFLIFTEPAFGDFCSAIPFFTNFGSSHKDSLTTMTCNPDSKNRLKCDFTQVFVNKLNLAGEILGGSEKFRKLAAEPDDELLEHMCTTNKKDWKENLQKQLKWTTTEHALDEDYRLIEIQIETSCIEKNVPNLRSALLAHAKFMDETCHIDVNNFTETFDKLSAAKYLSKDGPRGTCNVVVVSTLECNESTGGFWEFKSQIVDKTSNSTYCQNTPLNVQTVIGFNELRTLKRDYCKYID